MVYCFVLDKRLNGRKEVDIMLQPHIRSFFDTYFCCSLANANDKTLIDDGEYVLKPVRVGDSILLCGKVKIKLSRSHNHN